LLLPRSRFDGGDDVALNAHFGKSREGDGSVAPKVYNGLPQANHADLQEVLLLGTD
jgi:hypothetical protein